MLRLHLQGHDLSRLRDAEWRRGAIPPRMLGARVLGTLTEEVEDVAGAAGAVAGVLVDPALAPRLAATLPDARLQVLPGVGHLAMLESPEATARSVLGLAPREG